MEYRKLSEQVALLSNPQKSEAFIKAFRNAVREGQFDAADAPGRFELPKDFKRRNGEIYRRRAKEMILVVTPEFEVWFAEMDAQLQPKGVSKLPALEAYASGELDFMAAVERTRNQMRERAGHGQKLGKGRSKKKS